MRKLYSIAQKLVEFIYSNKIDMGKVFMFHEIGNDNEYEHYNNLKISETDFKNFIKYLNKSGKIKSIEDLEEVGEKTDYYLTFDDVHSNAYNNGIKWLIKEKIPFTIFVTVEYIGKSGYISIDELREMVNSGFCTIGSHTITHPMLRFKTNKEVKYEIEHSKKILEELTGREVEYFAYPYGSKYACSKKNIDIVGKLGYKKSFSTFCMGLNRKYVMKNNNFIPRINVDTKMIRKMEILYEYES